MRRLAKRWVKPAAWGAFLLACALTLAYAGGDAQLSSRVPKPNVTAEKGEKCVEDTEFMRRNHMKLLLHQRDETMHEGIRTKKYSLQNCIECHASKKDNSVRGSDNFCQSCHNYAAVKIDCFECHASKPKRSIAFHPLVPHAASGEAISSSAATLRHLRSANAQAANLQGGLSSKEIAGVIK